MKQSAKTFWTVIITALVAIAGSSYYYAIMETAYVTIHRTFLIATLAVLLIVIFLILRATHILSFKKGYNKAIIERNEAADKKATEDAFCKAKEEKKRKMNRENFKLPEDYN